MKIPEPQASDGEKTGCLGGLLATFATRPMNSVSPPAFDAPVPDPHAPIEDDEILFRCIQPKYANFENGHWTFDERAFTDPEKKISVDRAALCNGDAQHAQRAPTDGVCRLVAGEIRALDPIVQNNAKGKPTKNTHSVCIEPDPYPPPLRNNPAHAVIFGSPEITVSNVFRKLRLQLAQYAERVIERDGWDIAPGREYSQS